MPEQNPSRKEELEREALAYIRLGNLVQRSRTEDKAEAVAQVLAEAIDAEEKIRRIERIDGLPAGAEVRKAAYPRAKYSPPPSLAPRSKRAKQSVVEAGRRRSSIKADLPTNSALAYVLRSGAELRRKSKGNPFLRAGVFTLALDEDAARLSLERIKKDAASALAPALELATREGWRYLRKIEYNRLAALSRLVAELRSLDPSRVSPRNPGSAARLFPLEIAFLFFRSRRTEAGEAVASLEALLRKLAYPRAEIEAARDAARRLLQDRSGTGCLQDFELAYNMVRARRFLTIDHLLRGETEPLLSGSEFECPEDIQDRIDAHIGTLLERLDKLMEEGEKVLRLRAFVQRDDEGDIDYRPLADLYADGEAGGPSWDRDQDNAILLATALAERFVRMLEPFLAGTSGKDARPRVDDEKLDFEASMMRGVAAKLRRMLGSLPSLPWARFLAIKAQSAQATKFEAEGAGLVSEAADQFYKTGWRLAELLRSRDALPLEARAERGSEGALPSMDTMALRQALSAAATVAYLSALRFQEPSIGVALKNERQADDQRRDILGEIERLADAELFQEARKRAGLAPKA